MDIIGTVANVAIYFIPFLFSLCFHEFSHGWVAQKLGDDTAKNMGRLSMNPVVHADLVGTIILPIAVLVTGIPIFFGWAKPVPIDPRNLKNQKTDMFWIALAGPLSNVLLATLGAFALVGIAGYFHEISMYDGVEHILKILIQINLALAFFNLIPIHPLDGGKVLARFLSPQMNYKMEANQQLLSIFLLILFMSGALKFLSIPIIYTYSFLIHFAEKILIW